MTVLASCPFCRSEQTTISYKMGDELTPDRMFVKCSSCLAQGPTVTVSPSPLNGVASAALTLAADHARAEWNHAVVTPAPPAVEVEPEPTAPFGWPERLRRWFDQPSLRRGGRYGYPAPNVPAPGNPPAGGSSGNAVEIEK